MNCDMNRNTEGQWKLQPFKDKAPAFFFDSPPCCFHRWMQRLFFGFKWTRE